MRLLVLILLFTLIFVSQINTIVDSDLWCHFKTGEYIVKNLKVPHVDIFSYTLQNQPWVDHEWLSQIVFYFVFVKFGWIGINILKAITISLCFLVIVFYINSKYRNIIYAAFFIVLSVLAFGYRSFARPEIFSYLLLCIFFYGLEDKRRYYMLPLLQALWVNLHGYFILGPILVLLYLLGELIAGNSKKARDFIALFFLTGLACFINPYFYKGAFYPVNILIDVFTGQKAYNQTIHELMMPVSAGFWRYIFFWVFAILSSFTFLMNLKKARMQHVLIFLGSFMASYAAIRNMPIFIFMAMPLAAINLNEAAPLKSARERKFYAALILIVVLAAYFFISNKYYAFTDQDAFRKTESRMIGLLAPVKACDFLEANNIKGRIFNTIDFGHYISYRFYPEKRTLIDARTELYKYDFFRAYERAQNYPGEWRAMQEKYNFNTVLVRHLFSGTKRLLRYLYNDKEWALVYYDENSAVYLHRVPGNKELIERFKIDFRKKKIKKQDEVLSVATFFEKIEEAGLAEELYGRLLGKDPGFLEAGNNLSAIYINSRRFDDALKLIDGLLERYPGSAELYCNKGTAYLRMGRIEDGLSMLEKSARLNPYLRQASYLFGLVYMEKGYVDKAIRQFIKYLTLDPYSSNGHRMLGDAYKQKGLFKKAEAAYNEADKLEGKGL